MPIVWSITLSDAQISLLRAFGDWERAQQKAVDQITRSPKTVTSLLQVIEEGESPSLKFSHFVSHIRPLLRDKLIVHSTIKYGPNLQWVYNTYSLTEKGGYVLRIVEIEMEEMRERHLLGDGLPSSKGRDIRQGLEKSRRVLRSKG